MELSVLPMILCGDVNLDNRVTMRDALLIGNAVKGLVTLTDVQLFAADVDGNGYVNEDDASYIAIYLANPYDVPENIRERIGRSVSAYGNTPKLGRPMSWFMPAVIGSTFLGLVLLAMKRKK